MPEATPSKLDNLTLELLRFDREVHVGAIASHKRAIEAIDAEVVRRLGPDFMAAFAVGEKTHGELTLERDGLKIVGAIEREVKWDSKKLMEVASTLAWEKVKKVFKIEFSVPEAIYKAMTEEELLKSITAARTVKTKPLKVAFKAEKAE